MMAGCDNSEGVLNTCAKNVRSWPRQSLVATAGILWPQEFSHITWHSQIHGPWIAGQVDPIGLKLGCAVGLFVDLIDFLAVGSNQFKVFANCLAVAQRDIF